MAEEEKSINSQLVRLNEKIKRLETVLEEIRYNFKEAEQIAKFGFWSLDAETLNPTWTDGVFKLVGYNKEYGAPSLSEHREIIHHDDWNYFYRIVQKVLQTGENDEMDIRFMKPDGSIRIIKIIGKPKKDENGKTIGIRGTAQDITERKKIEKKLEESEKRYRYIVEKATAGMFILDEEGNINYLNEHMALMLHYSKKDMLNKPIKKFVDESDKFYRIRKPYEIQIEGYNWFKLIDKNGKIYWSNLTISPIFNNKKEYAGCLGIVTDINIQKGLEETYLEREEIFTQIIYDMMEMLNKIAKDETNGESNSQEQLN